MPQKFSKELWRQGGILCGLPGRGTAMWAGHKCPLRSLVGRHIQEAP